MASRYFTRTNSNAGTSNTTYTISAWIRRSNIATQHNILYNWDGSSSGKQGFLMLDNNNTDELQLAQNNNGTTVLDIRTTISGATGVSLRDTTGWYHIVAAVDTTQATSANRAILYVNGVRIPQSQYALFTVPAQNTGLAQSFAQQSQVLAIGDYLAGGVGSQIFDGLLTELVFVDGQALGPSVFGQYNNTGTKWIPQHPNVIRNGVGNFGINGFYLPFSNATSTTTLGYDYKTASRTSNNDFTPTGYSLSSSYTNEVRNDTPVTRYATLNPMDTTNVVISNGGTIGTGNNSAGRARLSLAANSGKWYCEYTLINYSNGGGIGILPHGVDLRGSISDIGGNSSYPYEWGFLSNNASIKNNGTQTSYGGSQVTNGQIVMCALDIDNGKVYWGLNGTWYNSGNPATGTNPAYSNVSTANGPLAFALGWGGSTSISWAINTGQTGFAYTPPAGFLPMTEQNIAAQSALATTPLIANSNFQVITYTGTGGSQTINTNFYPDFILVKNRSGSGYNSVADSVRGYTTSNGCYDLISFTGTPSASMAYGGYGSSWFSIYGGITSIANTSFTIQAGSSNPDNFNYSGATYTAWAFKAGANTSVTNTNGSVTSTVSANPTAGFSIVKFTSPASGDFTVGHGLGANPGVIWTKSYSSSAFNWSCFVQGQGMTNKQFMRLNTTDTIVSSGSNVWGSTILPNANTFGLSPGNGIEASQQCIAYCWAPIPGYSAFGQYVGVGSGQGPYVYTGFRPALVIIKPYYGGSPTTGWRTFDSSRNTYNTNSTQYAWYIESGNAEVTQNGIDFLSDGFVISNAGVGDVNISTSGTTYIYMAWAEEQLANANAR